ncbi:MAG: type II toxin-antitoxin system Y4mF family antitoxin [Candidatus Omnitrophota bacterium]|nr:type II toxin-antitoxin system Y4mF family antitoxin [Candidatus Omnitrophota bacterium]
MNLNEQIKELRKKSSLTQVEFAKRAGLGLRFVRELEQGKSTIRLDKLNQVLEFLGHHLEVKRNGPKNT